MKYWQYKAYDATGKVHTGVMRGAVDEVTIKLRQKGLQLFDARSITIKELNRLIRITKLKNILQKDAPILQLPLPPKRSYWKVVAVIGVLLALGALALLY